jgi:hypothetical protein
MNVKITLHGVKNGALNFIEGYEPGVGISVQKLLVPTEMHICEVNRLILNPGQLYKFSVDPACEAKPLAS